MSHIRHSMVGRPPKAGRAGTGVFAKRLAELSEWFTMIWGLRPSNRRLLWRVPFPDVVRGLQSIGGIANLARVSRKTVYRRKLQPGSVEALIFVIKKWEGTPRPLVRHETARHRLNIDHTLSTVLAFIAYLKATGGKTVRTWYDNKAPLKKWHRKHRMEVWENPANITDAKRRALVVKKKDGRGWVYEPEGRVTVPMVCGKLDWPRWKFYRWKESLTVYERKLLEVALNPAERQAIRATGIGETRELEPADLVVSADDVYERLYQQIDGG